MEEQPGTSSSSRQEERQASALGDYEIGGNQMFPVIYPRWVPTGVANSEPTNRGAGVYVVPTVHPFGGASLGFPSNDLIPLNFNIPTRPTTQEGVPNDHANGAEHPQPPAAAGPQRQVVRRFQIAFQIDMMLIIKLAAVIVLFNQDGSKQRLAVLVICAAIVYLYQTGSLAPVIRWLTDRMEVGAARPQPALRPENAPLIQRQNENAALDDPIVPGGDVDHPENRDEGEGGADNGGQERWGLVREIKMIVFGFITSLLPSFHNAD